MVRTEKLNIARLPSGTGAGGVTWRWGYGKRSGLASTPAGRRQQVQHADAKGPARRFPFAGIVRIRWMEVVGSSFNAPASQPFGSLARLAGHLL